MVHSDNGSASQKRTTRTNKPSVFGELGVNHAEIFTGREQIIRFLARKWQKELEYRLIKELFAFDVNRIAVRFAYEWRDDSNQWYRAYGNENWEYDENGLNQHRHASINDRRITEAERLFHWPQGRRPDDHAGLSALGL
jgi:hypothetical protein